MSTAAAAHLVEEDGLTYARELVVVDAPRPARFDASVLLEGLDGPPWHQLVVGLESDRFDMRSRLERALETATPRQRARLSTALSACYSGRFGFRKHGPDRAAFEEWLAGLSLSADRARPPWDDATPALADRVRAHGCTLVTFEPGTGHSPAGHDLLLYLLAEVDPGLAGALFDELAEVQGADAAEPTTYRLRAWLDGRRYEAAAHARGDRYDVGAGVGFLNAISRARGADRRYRVLGRDPGEVAYGSMERLRAIDDLAGG